jgi:hypothetical protein
VEVEISDEETYEQARKRHEIGHLGAQEITRNNGIFPEIGPLARELAEQRRDLALLRARLEMDAEAKELERRHQRAELTQERHRVHRWDRETG